MQTILDNMDDNIRLMETDHQGMYLGFSKLRHLGDAYELGAIWEGKTLNETVYIDTRSNFSQVGGTPVVML